MSVSLILLLENFVQPQLILNELIEDDFQYLNYRIQLEMLAIVTATLLKYRQHPYDSLPRISKQFFPMLTSNRRELRHGAIECFTVICSYFNSYKPMALGALETNTAIKLLLSSIESLSFEASNALRFRLQRNLLPSLTDEGNITPGLACDAATMNDPDAKFILLVNNPSSTPQPLPALDALAPSSASSKTNPPPNKLLQFAMPLAMNNKPNPNDMVSFSSSFSTNQLRSTKKVLQCF